MNSAFRIARREIVDTLSDWRLLVPLFCLGVLFPVFVVVLLWIASPYLSTLDSRIVVGRVVPFGAMLVGFLPTCFSLMLALESFVGEKERNTLETLLSLPLSDMELFLGKFLAVLIPVEAGNIVALQVYGFSLWALSRYTIAADFMVLLILLSLVEALVMIAGAVIISGHTSTVKAANLLAVFLIIPMASAIELQAILVLAGKQEMLWLFLMVFLVVGTILIRLGGKIFNREELLTRETKSLSLRLILGRVRTFFKQTPLSSLSGNQPGNIPAFTVRRLYLVDIPELLRLHVPAMVVVCLVLLAGSLLGYGMAEWYRIPISIDAVSSGNFAGISSNTVGAMQLPGGLFVDTARSFLAASALSVFTLGVGALVTMMFPMSITGFLAGGLSVAGSNPLMFLAAFVLPHGVVEFPTMVIAGAFSLRLGMAVMSPPRGYSVGDSLLLAAVNWVKIIPLVLPLFVVAALLEINVTPQVIRLLYGG